MSVRRRRRRRRGPPSSSSLYFCIYIYRSYLFFFSPRPPRPEHAAQKITEYFLRATPVLRTLRYLPTYPPIALLVVPSPACAVIYRLRWPRPWYRRAGLCRRRRWRRRRWSMTCIADTMLRTALRRHRAPAPRNPSYSVLPLFFLIFFFFTVLPLSLAVRSMRAFFPTASLVYKIFVLLRL